MKNNKILALRVALLIAVSEADKKKSTEDGGTSNMDTPIIFLPKWNKSAINEAFQLTGLIPSIHDNAVYILRACDGQGFRRTAMAEAFRDSLKASGYNAAVDYRMD
ncbi:MAG: hypothetical protein IJW93_02845 [Clostridia bacterium]|nr:hypothetical protein [Clostridia bacterium]